MRKPGKLVALLLAVSMLLCLTAAMAEELTEWEKFSNIFATTETDEELYQQALEQGATVTLYSISSRCTKVAEAFMKKYPGLECIPFDIDSSELLEKVSREHEAGIKSADLLFMKDQDGSVEREYVANKIFYVYHPDDIFAFIDEKYNGQAPMYIEVSQLFYNTDTYPDGAPLSNIWELTEEKWNGRIVLSNPTDDITWGAWLTGFCVGEEPDRLAAAYKELYGEDLVLSEGCENAGYEFLKRFHNNGLIYYGSSEEVANAIGTAGQQNAPIGFCSSTKYRKAADNGWKMAPVNLYPDTGIPGVDGLYVVEGCEHPAAAKLLARFMMGGVDGDLSGINPFLTVGSFPIRSDMTAPEGYISLEDMNLADFDAEAIYYNFPIVMDFWIGL